MERSEEILRKEITEIKEFGENGDHFIRYNDALKAVEKALSVHGVVERSEQLSDSLQNQIKSGELDPYSPHARWIKT